MTPHPGIDVLPQLALGDGQTVDDTTSSRFNHPSFDGSFQRDRQKRGHGLRKLMITLIALMGALLISGDVFGDSPAVQTSDCSNGIAVPDPANNPGLVSDCEALLSSRESIEGTVRLNWSPLTPISHWEGVGVIDDPNRVVAIDLVGDDHPNEIPRALGSLSQLRRLTLVSENLRVRYRPSWATYPTW